MHKLLKRQIRKYLPSLGNEEYLADFLQAVDKAYRSADDDRSFLEHSLEVTSQEVGHRYHTAKQQLEELLATKEQLEHSLSVLDATLEATCDGIAVLDENGDLQKVNSVAADILNLGNRLNQLPDANELLELLEKLVSNTDELYKTLNFNRDHPEKSSHCILEHRDGRVIACHTQPRWVQQKLSGRVWSLSDITDIKRSEQQALFHSYHDSLTGLPNRTLFHERVSHALERGLAQEQELAIIYIGLDGFKYVNDNLGLDIGDQLLLKVTERLKQLAPKATTLARYGGDEFVLLQENILNSFEPSLLAEQFRNSLASSIQVANHEINLTASLGIALSPTDGEEAESLIRKAGMAMYHAKSRGRNNTQYFADEIETLTAHRMSLRNSLKSAMGNNEFRLVYQPKVNLLNGKLEGCEALIRWQKADGSIVSPAEFIPAAEESGYIVTIGDWVVREACRQMSAWKHLAPEDFSIAVNISGQQFQHGDILSTIQSGLQEFALEPNYLQIEITESVAMADLKETIQTLTRLREIGILSSIDDFGTGYSSLSYLKQLPIDILKIDKMFVDDIPHSSRDLAMVTTVISLAHHLDMKVVAEGVETSSAASLLTQAKCDIAQGYLFSRPVDAASMTEILTNGLCLPDDIIPSGPR